MDRPHPPIPDPNRSTAHPEPWFRLVEGVAAHQDWVAGSLTEFLSENPEHARAHCLRGFARLFLGRSGLRSEVLQIANHAESLALVESDIVLAKALRAWGNDQPMVAERLLQRIIETHPSDLFVLKLQHGLLFMMGEQQAMFERLDRALDRWPQDVPGRHFLEGAMVFALCETGHPEEGLSLDNQRRQKTLDPWGLHGTAHCYWTLGRYQELVAWLDRHDASFASCNNFREHIGWHRALSLLKLGRAEAALDYYDRVLADAFDGDYRDLSNAASLLWFADHAGMNVRSRWEHLGQQVLGGGYHIDHGSGFADVHYAATLYKAGRHQAVHDMIDDGTEPAPGFQYALREDITRTLCRGFVDPEPAQLEALRALSSQLVRLGGSNAQREFVHDVLASILDEAGHQKRPS